METEFDSNVDYYRVLGLNYNATQDEIKQSHIQLALKYHPDVNKEINIEKYRDIQNAYNILSRPEVRESYDLTRRRFIHKNDYSPGKNSNYRDLNKNIDIPNYDVQRIQFKETQKHASSNWRELKDKYKSEQWQKKDLAFKKNFRARPLHNASKGLAIIGFPIIITIGGIIGIYKFSKITNKN